MLSLAEMTLGQIISQILSDDSPEFQDTIEDSLLAIFGTLDEEG